MSDVQLRTRDGSIRFDADLTDPPTYSGGRVGGFEEVSRDRRVSSLEFVGTSPAMIVLPLIVDGWSATITYNIESRLKALEALAKATPGTFEPPKILLVSRTVRSPATTTRWVINEIEWGDTIRRNGDLRITQQWLTVTLVEYVAAQVQLAPVAAARSRKR